LQKRKAVAKASGENYNRITQQRKKQRQAKSTSSKTPDFTLCDKAKELIVQFDALVEEFAKYENTSGGLVQYVAEKGKATPDDANDIVRIVEQGQDAHGLMFLAEGPLPGNTPADFTKMTEQIKSETPERGAPVFAYDHWTAAHMNSKEHKKEYDGAFSGWPTPIYMEAASQVATLEDP